MKRRRPLKVVRGLAPGETIGEPRWRGSRITSADDLLGSELAQEDLVECERCHALVCGETLGTHPCTDEVPGDGGQGSCDFAVLVPHLMENRYG